MRLMNASFPLNLHPHPSSHSKSFSGLKALFDKLSSPENGFLSFSTSITCKAPDCFRERNSGTYSIQLIGLFIFRFGRKTAQIGPMRKICQICYKEEFAFRVL